MREESEHGTTPGDQFWKDAPVHLTLPEGEVHVWRVSVPQNPLILRFLREQLSVDERVKADRFHFEKDRRCYTVAHGALRILLARYLHIAPPEATRLPFSQNAYGKPALVTGELNFNLSHSHELVLLAFARTHQVGVDVEYMRPGVDNEELSKHYFSVREYAMLQALPLAMRREAFYHCWARKEAYIKARGMGLSLPLGSFDVSVHPEEPAVLLGSREETDEHARWELCALQAGAAYAAALVVEGLGESIRCWQLAKFGDG
jgi:4'-phosphopantetheinyl transferase